MRKKEFHFRTNKNKGRRAYASLYKMGVCKDIQEDIVTDDSELFVNRLGKNCFHKKQSSYWLEASIWFKNCVECIESYNMPPRKNAQAMSSPWEIMNAFREAVAQEKKKIEMDQNGSSVNFDTSNQFIPG